MKSQGVEIVNYADRRRRRRGIACLLWGFGISFCLLLALVVISGAIYAGWNAGLATARAESAAATQAEIQIQCGRIPQDLAEGSLRRAQLRFEALLKQGSSPACLAELAPSATAAFLLAASSPTPPPTDPPAPPQPSATPTVAVAAAPATIESADIAVAYDLDALLEEAQSAMRLKDYPTAIDTLDAIISIDEAFQRELVRRLFLDALRAEALALFRSGRLSEAIVMTDRAEEQGSIDDLYHERFIALLYLNGQRYKIANPGEAVRMFSSMYYEFGVRDYVNGPIAVDLQEALRNYAMALALQGDHCPAQAQFEAALELRPAFSRVNLADLTARRDQSRLACQAQQQGTVDSAGAADSAQQTSTLAPVGYSG